MRFTNIALIAMMLAGTAGSAQATTAGLMINVTFTQPSCDITLPPSYNLGMLAPGGPKDHGDFNITWTCQGTPVKTALTAGIVTGIAEGDDKVRMMVGGQATGVRLSLREKGATQPIKLTGSEANYF